jgi:hypothetical protein
MCAKVGISGVTSLEYLSQNMLIYQHFRDKNGGCNWNKIRMLDGFAERLLIRGGRNADDTDAGIAD